MQHLLSKLNPQQREAVEAVDGPVLILAGAGSGKTRVITHRIAYLIEERNVAPDSILAVTFTNKAAAEMAERVDKLLAHGSLAKPQLSTFHSFCVRLLRRDIESLRIGGEGLTRTFAIYDESDQQSLVKQVMRRMGLDDKQLTPRVVLSRISWAKNHMLDPQEYYLGSADPTSEKVAHVFEAYRKELRKANALDFDDLLLEAVRVLKSSAEVCERYNRRYRYLLIDEYQDTNRPQYELMKLLAGTGQNVCVVGDEDQSIYSWRGADIKNILEFEKDFPNVKTVRLEQNYRSTQMILEAAGAVVSRNAQRKGKHLWTARQGGSLIGYYEAPDGENEALFIADQVNKYLRKAGQESDGSGEPPRAAVLYRTNSQSRLVEEALRRYGISYTMVGGFSFYDRSEIKDLLSYLKLVQNTDDSIALQRVINTPPRGIGKTTMETIERLALETGTSLWTATGQAVKGRLLPQRALLALENFRRLIQDARAMLAPGFDEKLAADLANQPDQELSEAAGSGMEGEPASSLEQDPADVDTSFDFADFDDDGQGLLGLESFGDELKVDATEFNPFLEVVDESGFQAAKGPTPLEQASLARVSAQKLAALATSDDRPAFRKPGDAATLPEIIRFLIDRTGYIRALEEEGTPESLSRIENLKELANAAQDAQARGETLHEFLDHAALVSDVDKYDPSSRVTLMTLHAAKGLEFPLVLLAGMEEGLFPHSRTLNAPNELEEERRLCYVGMTRAMDTLLVTRARYRRRYGNDMPEASLPSRFLEEIPAELMEDLSPVRARTQSWSGGRSADWNSRGRSPYGDDDMESGRHYSYEDEDQSARASSSAAAGSRYGGGFPAKPTGKSGAPAGSLDNIAQFFSAKGKSGYAPRPKLEVPPAEGATGFKSGERVRHPKYGDGVVFRTEGDGDLTKVTVQFAKFGVKKLVEKFANLEKV
ncbi:ATP-dependent DNA helicase UvrD/PcrA [Acidisarcina polymorpha]|uniref:DNA 3'-5' helicase n=1 Tax=Acidisarcina polymorpha TaxID=2211140 RepID=A0A2Z5FZ88_9BACT|nr:UvrD-helicase domain-containing protein [Acidisarcina polymorpha]AXC11725.1 ATP-dependent DNA helicase UvrD/PcrA [Acidisarcina polymorpha]